MRHIVQQSTSLITEPRQIIVRDLEAFKLLWRQHQGSLEHLPDVDFKRDMLVAIFLGEQPTGGFEVKITTVEEDEQGLKVFYKIIEPNPDFMVIQMLTAPVHMLAVPARDSEIEFIQQ